MWASSLSAILAEPSVIAMDSGPKDEVFWAASHHTVTSPAGIEPRPGSPHLSERSARSIGSSTVLRQSSRTGAEANPLLAAIRREVEASEERLALQVRRLERQMEEIRVNESVLPRLDAKFANFEAWQPECERRLSEVSGAVRGLTDELQAIIRRVSQTDSRALASQRRAEESCQARAAELAHDTQSPGSATCAPSTSQDHVLRLSEKLQHMQGCVDSLAQLHGRRLDSTEAQLEFLAEEHERARKGAGHAAEAELSSGSRSTALIGPNAPPTIDILRVSRDSSEAANAAERATLATEELKAEFRRVGAWSQKMEERILSLTEQFQAQDAHLRNLSRRFVQGDRDVATREQGERRPSEMAEPAPLAGGTVPKQSSRDQKLIALEEKLAGRTEKASSSKRQLKANFEPINESAPSRSTLPERSAEFGTASSTPSSQQCSEKATEPTPSRELHSEVTDLARKMAAHDKLLADLQNGLTAIVRKVARVSTNLGSSQDQQRSTDQTSGTLSAEVTALRSCIASGEEAIRSLAPRLLQVAAVTGSSGNQLEDAVRALSKATTEELLLETDGDPKSVWADNLRPKGTGQSGRSRFSCWGGLARGR